MASPINLLPVEFSPSGAAAKLAKLLNNAVFLGFTVFILVLVGGISFFLINYFSLQDFQKKQEALSTSIELLEATETRLVLVQDRLKLVKVIKSKESVISDLTTFASILPTIGGGLSLAEVDLRPNKTEFSVLATNSSELAKFMAALTAGELYKKVDLTSFSYSPTAGYSSSFETQTK
jgi:Tfp pilus assembly protein PilN